MTISRAAAWGLALFALLASLSVARGGEPAATIQQLSVPSREEPIHVTRYSLAFPERRPAVLILPGQHGIGQANSAREAAYERYALSLIQHGVDAYLVSYYTAADADRILRAGHTDSSAYVASRFRDWAGRIGDVATYMAARNSGAGPIGLLGFSLGGYVAAAAAAEDPRASALVVFYGGIPVNFAGKYPTGFESGIHRLPPLLELHGSLDKSVPLAKGRALVDLAKALGNTAELQVYPGAGHAFDRTPNDPNAAAASAEAVAFLVQHLRAE